MSPEFFKTDIDEDAFREHARDHYEIGTVINPDGMFHPVWALEAATMNYERWLDYKENVNER